MKAFSFELTRVQTNAVRRRVVAMLANVDARLAEGVADRLGIEVPEPLPPVLKRPPKPEVEVSKPLSLLARPGTVGIRTRRIALLVADGVHGASLRAVHAALADAGAVPRYLGSKLGTVQPDAGRPIDVEITIEAAPSALFDAVVLPDGAEAVRTLSADGHAVEFVKDQFRHCKPMLVLGAATVVLEAAGVPTKTAPGVVRAAAGEAGSAVAQFAKLLERHRMYERETDPPAV
jgi:catalase